MSEENGFVAAEVIRYKLEANNTLARVYRRTGFESCEEKTPLDFLLESEEGELEEWGVRRETIRRMFDYFSQDGLEPDRVLKNVYAVAAHMHLDPWAALTVRERGVLLGESHGSQHYRMQKIIVNRLRRVGARSIKPPGGKALHTAAHYSECQEGNENRKRKPRSRHKRWKRIKKKQEKNT